MTTIERLNNNYVESMKTSIICDDLTLLSLVGIGDTICIKDRTIVTHNSYWIAFKRYWTSENRNQTIEWVCNTVNSDLCLIKQVIDTDIVPDIEMYISLLASAKIGVMNLRTTYKDESELVHKLDILLQDMSDMIFFLEDRISISDSFNDSNQDVNENAQPSAPPPSPINSICEISSNRIIDAQLNPLNSDNVDTLIEQAYEVHIPQNIEIYIDRNSPRYKTENQQIARGVCPLWFNRYPSIRIIFNINKIIDGLMNYDMN